MKTTKLMRLTAFLLLALLALFAFSGCGEKEADLRVGFDAEFPPYGFMGEDGEYTGFDIEMAKALCERLDWTIELIPIDWGQKDMELEAGTINCIWNGFTMNDREAEYTWTDAYMDNSQVFIVRADSGIAALADLAGKTVSVQKESSAESALNAEENAALLASLGSLTTAPDYNTSFMELESGAVDAIAMDIGVAKFQIQGREDSFTILDEPLQSEQYGVGFLLGNTELRDKVQAELEAMSADGTFAGISNEWFGYDVGIIGK